MVKRTPEFVGKITQYHAMVGESVTRTARRFNLSWHTCHLALTEGSCANVRSKRRQPLEVFKRRSVLRKLVSKTERTGNHEYAVHPSASALRNELHQRGIDVCKATVVNDLHACGLVCRVRRSVPVNDPAVHQKRFDFSVRVLRRGRRYMRRVVFSDEHMCCTNDYTSRLQWVHPGESTLPREHKRVQNVPRCMVWGAIGIDYKSPLVVFPQKNREDEAYRLNSDAYVRKCLSPVCHDLVGKRVLQQDGARIHIAARVGAYLQRNGIEILQRWPPYSPDLNPIEQLWSLMQRRVAELHPQSQTGLEHCVQTVWKGFAQAEINALCASFESKLKRCRALGGRC